MLFFSFLFVCRIQILLQHLIQPLYSQQSFPHRRKYLNIQRFCLHIGRQFFLNQIDDGGHDHIRIISFQKEKVLAVIIDTDFLSRIDLMSIHYNITLRCLPKDLIQFYHAETLRIYNVFQHPTGPYAGKLIHVSHQNQTGSHRTAVRSACIREISTMDISSIMITSASSGFSSFRSKCAAADDSSIIPVSSKGDGS